MGENKIKSEENITKMFSGQGVFSSDHELALEIIKKFNISADTLEIMPAFENHIGPLFSKIKEK